MEYGSGWGWVGAFQIKQQKYLMYNNNFALPILKYFEEVFDFVAAFWNIIVKLLVSEKFVSFSFVI